MQTVLRQEADTLRDLQKLRIRLGNQIAALTKQDQRLPEDVARLKTWFKTLQKMEREVAKEMGGLLKEEVVWNRWLKHVHGVGPRLGAKLLAELDFSRAKNPSAFWQFAGLGTKGGKAIRLTSGVKNPFNMKLRVTCFQIANSFLQLESPYSKLYYRAKEKYQAAHPDWTPMHIHLAAIRIMMKIFLEHLWQKGREALGLPRCQPYVVAYLGHTDYIAPEEMVVIPSRSRSKRGGRRRERESKAPGCRCPQNAVLGASLAF